MKKRNKAPKLSFYFIISVLIVIFGIILSVSHSPAENDLENKILSSELFVQFKPNVSIEEINSINKVLGTEINEKSSYIPNAYWIKIISERPAFEVIKKHRELQEVQTVYLNIQEE